MEVPKSKISETNKRTGIKDRDAEILDLLNNWYPEIRITE